MVENIRKIKHVIVTANNVVDDGNGIASEKIVNDAIDSIKKDKKIVSIIAHNAGMKPLQLIYDIIYEEDKGEHSSYTRYIKTIISTINEIPTLEQRVNDTVEELYKKGGKAIAFVPHNFGINPILVIYDIVYEAESPIEITEV